MQGLAAGGRCNCWWWVMVPLMSFWKMLLCIVLLAQGSLLAGSIVMGGFLFVLSMGISLARYSQKTGFLPSLQLFTCICGLVSLPCVLASDLLSSATRMLPPWMYLWKNGQYHLLLLFPLCIVLLCLLEPAPGTGSHSKKHGHTE